MVAPSDQIALVKRFGFLAVLSVLFFLATVVQIFLGGYGVFFGSPLSGPGNHLEPHRTLGNIIAALALVVLISAIVTRRRSFIVVAAIAFVLCAVTGSIADQGVHHQWLGGVHVLLAFAIAGCAGWLAHKSAEVMRKGVVTESSA